MYHTTSARLEIGMLLLAGSPALSDSRFELLKTRLTSLDPALSLERAFYVYAVDATGEPDRVQLFALRLQVLRRAEPIVHRHVVSDFNVLFSDGVA